MSNLNVDTLGLVAALCSYYEESGLFAAQAVEQSSSGTVLNADLLTDAVCHVIARIRDMPLDEIAVTSHRASSESVRANIVDEISETVRQNANDATREVIDFVESACGYSPRLRGSPGPIAMMAYLELWKRIEIKVH